MSLAHDGAFPVSLCYVPPTFLLTIFPFVEVPFCVFTKNPPPPPKMHGPLSSLLSIPPCPPNSLPLFLFTYKQGPPLPMLNFSSFFFSVLTTFFSFFPPPPSSPSGVHTPLPAESSPRKGINPSFRHIFCFPTFRTKFSKRKILYGFFFPQRFCIFIPTSRFPILSDRTASFFF